MRQLCSYGMGVRVIVGQLKISNSTVYKVFYNLILA
ncbi:hypothetical protein [Arsenophonus sp. PmNCSU2021_1]